MNYWQNHGWLFLFGMACFPRVTLLFFTTLSFGLWSWLGWIFCPHLLVAIIATTIYWHTNPVLVVFAWFMAFGGTGSEVEIGKRASR